MKWLKSCSIAFSMYSKIPMPQFLWEDEDMRYVMCFFPLVGVVIGMVTVLWWYIAKNASIGMECVSMIGLVIPILISGGIHLDGFIDTMDALSSYQSRERKLEILKDSHIGAFALIQLLMYACIYLGAYSELKSDVDIYLVALGFVLSRILSGIGVVTFKCAKHDGLLYYFSSKSQEVIVRSALIGEFVLCAVALGWIGAWRGIFVLVVSCLVFAYYKWKCDKEFGGITGDTAGWFVSICECAIVVSVALCSMISLLF